MLSGAPAEALDPRPQMAQAFPQSSAFNLVHFVPPYPSVWERNPNRECCLQRSQIYLAAASKGSYFYCVTSLGVRRCLRGRPGLNPSSQAMQTSASIPQLTVQLHCKQLHQPLVRLLRATQKTKSAQKPP